MAESAVTALVNGRVGVLRLDRPKALNALDLPMIGTLANALEAWRAAPAVHAVVIESANERAFCAGGDIRTMREFALAGDRGRVTEFFRAEYGLNAALAAYPKPVIALIDGICMGGGLGISAHGEIRVATEHALCAMPETAIGFFPDIGATYFLPRLPGCLGFYLGLTGARLVGADAVHAGLATHFVPRAHLPALRAALPTDGAAAVAGFAQTLPPFTLGPYRAAIDRCFSGQTVADVIAALSADSSEWAANTLAVLRTMSPTAVSVTLDALRHGATLELPDALEAELRLAQAMTRHPDFAEGVRAMLVDKDRTPRWQTSWDDRRIPN